MPPFPTRRNRGSEQRRDARKAAPAAGGGGTRRGPPAAGRAPRLLPDRPSSAPPQSRAPASPPPRGAPGRGLPAGTAAGTPARHHGLEDTAGPPERGQQVLHGVRPHLAVGGVRLPRAGVRGGRRACVGGRAEGLRLQHEAAGLYQRLLRQLLPHFQHPPLGPAAHLRHVPLAAGHPARGLPRGARAAAPPEARGPVRQAVRQRGQEARRPVVDLLVQPHLQARHRAPLPVRAAHALARLRHAAPGAVRQRGALPQRRGLLHRPAHREEGLHLLHGRGLCRLHRAHHLRDLLPHFPQGPAGHNQEQGPEKPQPPILHQPGLHLPLPPQAGGGWGAGLRLW